MRAALLSAVSAQDIRAMAAAMVTAAKGGDAACFRVLAPYLFGKPLDSEDAPSDAPKSPLYVECTHYIRENGTEIEFGDADFPTELANRRFGELSKSYENVVQIPGSMANA
jgi:hypothetical protein